MCRRAEQAINPCAAAAATAIFACGSAAWCSSPPALPRVEQGVGDVEPLGMTLRDMQVDLRTPSGFDGVYRLDRTDAFGTRETLFMRMDGGVTAVFPKSLYTPTRDGLVPTIPPGTIFYLGGLPPGLQPLPQDAHRPRPANFLDLSIDVHVPAEPAPRADMRRSAADAEPMPAFEPTAPRPQRTLWNDEAYRNRRIATLLRRSVEEEGR